MDIDIKAEDDAILSMEVVDTLGFLELAEEGCEEFTDDVSDARIEPFTDDEGNFGCRISGNIGDASDSEDFWIYKEGNELVFKMSDLDSGLGDDDEDDLDLGALDMFAPDIAVSVTFPGKVTYASEGGTINGNTVTWEGILALSGNVEARGQASGGLFGGGGSSDSGDDVTDDVTDDATEQAPTDDIATNGSNSTPGGSDSDATQGDTTTSPQSPAQKGGFPWLVTILGVALLLIIFLIVMVARRGRSDAAAAQQFPPHGQYTQHDQYPPHDQQPPHGQYPPQQ